MPSKTAFSHSRRAVRRALQLCRTHEAAKPPFFGTLGLPQESIRCSRHSKPPDVRTGRKRPTGLAALVQRSVLRAGAVYARSGTNGKLQSCTSPLDRLPKSAKRRNGPSFASGWGRSSCGWRRKPAGFFLRTI
jgi:hypothetical protein